MTCMRRLDAAMATAAPMPMNAPPMPPMAAAPSVTPVVADDSGAPAACASSASSAGVKRAWAEACSHSGALSAWLASSGSTAAGESAINVCRVEYSRIEWRRCQPGRRRGMAGTVHSNGPISGNSGRLSCSTLSLTHSHPVSARGVAWSMAPREMPLLFSAAPNLLPRCKPSAPMHAPSCPCVGTGSPIHQHSMRRVHS